MTDFCQHVPMSRLFETQNSRGFIDPTLRSLCGVIEIQPLRGCKKSVFYQTRAILITLDQPAVNLIPSTSPKPIVPSRHKHPPINEKKKTVNKRFFFHNMPKYSPTIYIPTNTGFIYPQYTHCKKYTKYLIYAQTY